MWTKLKKGSRDGVYLRSSVDVTDISSDSRCVSDIVEGETGDKRIQLHEKGKRLTNSTGGAKDDDFSLGDGLGREATTEKRLLRRGRRTNEHRSEHFRVKSRVYESEEEEEGLREMLFNYVVKLARHSRVVDEK